MKKLVSLILAIMMSSLFLLMGGCAAETLEETSEKLKESGYEVVIENDSQFCAMVEETEGIESGRFEGMIKAEKEEDFVYIYYFKDEISTKKMLNQILELKKDADPEKVEDNIIEMDGTKVYLGTKLGISDAKK